jgi:hypothetical protein
MISNPRWDSVRLSLFSVSANGAKALYDFIQALASI